ncbi:V-set domain-containing T-cell activation inhibitor 1 isoform X3 [Oncorhynchus tshawytscha]|uniref:V-set domain-containing T-cell activation inhibitor 1 isoform X3 n=1 Tax=Oncorhynchus tshawytscha TaxID=74940 RepID=UPI001C3D1D85|nr:V-set domain-containing T-cell activation inhibitor 1 isoform X3 [Oncorhynchus tshawytscha]
MASLGQIIFWGMIVMIFVAAGLIILILSVSFAVQGLGGSQGTVDSNNKWPIGNLGEDVILSCKFKTSTNSGESTSQVSITWKKKGLSEVVYRYNKGAVQLTEQNPQFKDRTQLFSDAIGGGNASMLLRNVKMKDEGVYYCSVNAPSGSGTDSVNLRVADIEISTTTFFSFSTAAAPPILLPQRHVLAATTSFFFWIYQLT